MQFDLATNLYQLLSFFPSFGYLERSLLTFFRPTGKSVFGIHDPVGLRYLFQLRLGLSNLHSHKMRHGFTDIQSDLCLSCKHGAEDSYHFLLKCTSYDIQRATLMNSVNAILLTNNLNYPANFPLNELNLFLYGHPSVSHSENKLILMSTIKFIRDSGRFST